MKNSRLEFLRRRALNKGIAGRMQAKDPVELIVKADHGKKNFLEKELRHMGEVTRVFDSIPYLSFRCDAADAFRLNQVFRRLSDAKAYRSVAAAVSVIDISSVMSLPKTRKSSLTRDVWNLERIGAYHAMEFASGSGVSVAVIDTGVDYAHPEVSASFGSLKGYDFVRNDSDPMDRNGHGTHVAGVVVGRDYGLASGAACYSVRVLDENGMGTEADTIAGLDWVAKNRVDVVNMSMGSPSASAALEDMCYYLANKGVLIAAAAGNKGFGASYPAAFGEPVIAVAAVDRQDRHAEFSNIYETNDVSAPGVGITSSYLGGYATLSGTSMASPHVAGSLVLALSVAMRGIDLEELLESTAERLDNEPFPRRDVYGAGLVRADRMVSSLAGQNVAKPGYGREIFHALKEVLWA